MTAGFFITGIGTGVGKTFFTALLTRQLGLKGEAVQPLKPVITGFSGDKTDSHLLLRAAGREPTTAALADISPWRFVAPLSPEMAAAREGKILKAREIANFCRAKESKSPLLVEGVGGVMTPINPNETVMDILADLRYAVILVAGTYLGALSHALTAYYALLQYGLPLHAILLNESKNSPVSLEAMHESLVSQTRRDMKVFTLPRLAEGEAMWKTAPDLTGILHHA